MADVDIYPVGWLAALRSAWRYLTMPNPGGTFSRRFWWLNLRREWRYCVQRARAGNWRAVRMSFNGYLAEPNPFPEGVRRCGSGWTRARARRSLERQIRKAEDAERDTPA